MSGENENQRGRYRKHERLPNFHGSLRQLPHARARIEGIELPIGEAIEAHGRAAGADHGDQNPEKSSRPRRMGRPGQRQGGQREGQREDGVGETDEAAVVQNFGFQILDPSTSLRTGFGL